jgi:hypothetical protein
MGRHQFSYKITKDGKVFVYWQGRPGQRDIVINGARAENLIRDLPGMDPEQ